MRHSRFMVEEPAVFGLLLKSNIHSMQRLRFLRYIQLGSSGSKFSLFSKSSVTQSELEKKYARGNWPTASRLLASNSAIRKDKISTETSVTHAFDRSLKQKQRENAARACKKWRQHNRTSMIQYDYIHEEIASRLVDRLDDVKRTDGFPLALDLGAGPGYIHRAICADDFIYSAHESQKITGPLGGIGGVRKLVQMDNCAFMLRRDEDIPVEGSHRCDSYRIPIDNAEDEKRLPFPNETFDLVISSAYLHWVNQLPGLFQEVSRVLKPDGCFIFAMVGGTTLTELRTSLIMAELEREGGISPRVGPFVGLSDVGSLLLRAGFALPTLDIDTFTISFPNVFVLKEHLQRMGENNACIKRRGKISKDVLLAAACIYDHLFRLEESPGEIKATIQVIYGIGWKPHDSQQKPLQRGTATLKVGEIVETIFTEKQ